MNKLNKVFCFIATFMFVLVATFVVSAKADITINVVKPADWSSVSVHAWTSKGDITTWPGLALTQNGDKYTVTIKANTTDKVFFKLNDGGKSFQTTNVDGLTDTNGKGAGLTEGTYDITITNEKNTIGHNKWTAVKLGETTSTVEATTPTVAPTTGVATNNTNNDSTSPKTGESPIIMIAAILAVVSGGAFLVARKKVQP